GVVSPGPDGSAGVQCQRMAVAEGDRLDGVNGIGRSDERAVRRRVVADLSVSVVAAAQYGVGLRHRARAQDQAEQVGGEGKQRGAWFHRDSFRRAFAAKPLSCKGWIEVKSL